MTLKKIQLALIAACTVLASTATAQDAQPQTASPAKTSWYQAPSKALKVDAMINLAMGWTEQTADGIDARPLMSVHRARLWFRGQASSRLKYVAHLAMDRIGADEFSLLQGRPFAAGRSPVVQDFFLQYDAFGDGKLRLTAGFVRPQVGRENNTAVVGLATQEPALTSSLARIASVQAGHGRATGVDFGGRLAFGAFKTIYHLGVFTPTSTGTTPDGVDYNQSMGSKSAPLIAGSLILGYGDLPQLKGGDYIILPNNWSRGTDIMVGGSASMQGETDRFEKSEILTAFGSVNAANIVIDGEFVTATRAAAGGDDYQNQAWHVRAGYNIYLKQTVVAPFVLYTELKGDDITPDAWNNGTQGLGLFAGKGSLIDAGINWNFRRNQLQLGLHAIKTTLDDDGPLRQPIREGFSGFISLQAQR